MHTKQIKVGLFIYCSTTGVYITKRGNHNFCKKVNSRPNKVKSKFLTRSIYGILRSKSVLLKKITVGLDKPIHIKNIIDRLSKGLRRSLSQNIQNKYTRIMINALEKEPLILIDDTDVIKPHVKEFEGLGMVLVRMIRSEMVAHCRDGRIND